MFVGFALNYSHCVQTQSIPEGQGWSTERCGQQAAFHCLCFAGALSCILCLLILQIK